MNKPTTVTLKLAEWEIKELVKPEGSGGHQGMHRDLMAALQPDGSIELDDSNLGRLVRHMGYGSGGFQGRLRKAFLRPLLIAMGART